MSKIRRNWFPLTLALCILACLVFVVVVFAQVSPQIQGAGAPSNPCNNGGQQYVDQTNHVIYSCPSSGANWVNIQLGQATGTGFSNNGVALTTSVPLLAPDGSSSAPAYSFSGNSGLGFYRQSSSLGVALVNSTFTMGGSGSIIDISFLSGSFRFYGNGNSGQIIMRSPLVLGDGSTGGTLLTNPNCQLGGASGTTSPAACGAASAGMIAVPAGQTSYTVNTSAVDANSEIFIQQMTDNSGLPSSPTCNSGATNPIQSARVAGTSFTLTQTSVASVTCFKYWIVN